MPPPTLLSLPRELRDQILLYTLHSNWDIPTKSLRSPNDETDFPYEHAKWQPSPLLLTSHQLRQEAREAIATLHKSSSIFFELDLHVTGIIITPTWTKMTSALQLQDSLDELKVNMKLHTTEAFRRTIVGDPGVAFYLLATWLNKFIHRGPSFLDDNPPFKTPGPHFVKRLSLHISFEDWYTPATWAETVHEIFRMMKALSLLKTAHKHIGKIHVSTAYTYRGHNVSRDREFDVVPADQAIFEEFHWPYSEGVCLERNEGD